LRASARGWLALLGLSATGLACFSATLDRAELDAKAAGTSAGLASSSEAVEGGGVDAGAGFTVALDTPPIELDYDGEDLTRDACVATTEQARSILEEHCSACHAPPAAMGGFRSVLDFPVLITLGSGTQRDPVTGEPVRLVVPGDPDGSRLYRRVAENEMPPTRDASFPALPRPTISDVSVLREWIDSCLPAAPVSPPLSDAGLQ